MDNDIGTDTLCEVVLISNYHTILPVAISSLSLWNSHLSYYHESDHCTKETKT